MDILSFVLSHYVVEGVEELDQEKLTHFFVLNTMILSPTADRRPPTPTRSWGNRSRSVAHFLDSRSTYIKKRREDCQSCGMK